MWALDILGCGFLWCERQTVPLRFVPVAPHWHPLPLVPSRHTSAPFSSVGYAFGLSHGGTGDDIAEEECSEMGDTLWVEMGGTLCQTIAEGMILTVTVIKLNGLAQREIAFFLLFLLLSTRGCGFALSLRLRAMGGPFPSSNRMVSLAFLMLDWLGGESGVVDKGWEALKLGS